jgi:hypothetical protein
LSGETVADLLELLSPAEAELSGSVLRNAAERADRAWRYIDEPQA